MELQTHAGTPQPGASIYSGFIFLLLLCVFSVANAQENLRGKWVSYSMTYRGKEIPLKEKQEETLLIFEPGQNYVRCYYAYNTGANSSRLTYHLMSGKVEDATGKVLKQKRVKEEGVYQVHKDSIVFVVGNERYAALYKFEGKTLHLTQYVQDSLIFTLKFKTD